MNFPTFYKLTKRLPPGLAAWAASRYWAGFWRNEADAHNSGELAGSERAMLHELISRQYPFESILEVGCSYGQNFRTLMRLFPKVKMVGVDIDFERVAAATAWAQITEGAENVSFMRRDIADMSAFRDNSYDCVISSAALMYIAAPEIAAVSENLVRIAKNCVLLLEQHSENPQFPEQHLGVKCAGRGTEPAYWIRDYRGLFERVGDVSVEVVSIKNRRWDTEQWQNLGAIIEVKKRRA